MKENKKNLYTTGYTLMRTNPHVRPHHAGILEGQPLGGR